MVRREDGKGWHKESRRHALARRGIKTAKYVGHASSTGLRKAATATKSQVRYRTTYAGTKYYSRRDAAESRGVEYNEYEKLKAEYIIKEKKYDELVEQRSKQLEDDVEYYENLDVNKPRGGTIWAKQKQLKDEHIILNDKNLIHYDIEADTEKLRRKIKQHERIVKKRQKLIQKQENEEINYIR